MKKIYLIFILMLLVVSSNAQQITNIIDLRENNSTGVPVGMDNPYKVTGIVTSANQLGGSGPASLEDSTAGISIYGNSFAGIVNIGDSVTVESALTHYNGLTQFNFSSSASSVVVHKSNLNVEPRITSINEIISQKWNGSEELESRLVIIKSVSINANGTFEGGINYSISDSTGILEMRIDSDVSSIIGSTIPTSTIDLIGIIGQYDSSPPYSTGYQILPRFISDIITTNEPLILSPIIPADITPSSFTVYFNTSREGNTEIKYGLTNELELGDFSIDELTTKHKITVSNLDEITTYYFQVFSSNNTGKSKSPIYSVSTSSSDPSIGKINVYFNYSVDTTVSIENNNANGKTNFKSKLLNRINSANYSIDIAVYSFYGLDDVANAIISARNDRDVKVRVVYHNRTMQSSMQLLVNAGIKVSQRSDNAGLMHNKFLIVDARDSIYQNDWIWTGSWNWNSKNNRNNVVEINDPSIAQAYTKEFEEMWGSNNDNPSSIAKFGANKSDNTPHTFNIGGKRVDLYFSPSDQTEAKIVNVIQSADTSVFFSLLSFTSDPIFNAINDKYNNGVTDLRGIIDNVNDNGGEFYNLQPISDIFEYNKTGLFHHKYSIIDSYSFLSNPTVITGSHNWSRSANEKNDENTLIIYDQNIANQYMQEFKSRYNELGGSNAFPIPIITSVKNSSGTVPSEIKLYQNYPNPFNPSTVINYAIPNAIAKGNNKLHKVTLRVFDILGREVATLVDNEQEAGNYNVLFNADNMSSGTYIYMLKIGSNILIKKMLLIR